MKPEMGVVCRTNVDVKRQKYKLTESSRMHRMSTKNTDKETCVCSAGTHTRSCVTALVAPGAVGATTSPVYLPDVMLMFLMTQVIRPCIKGLCHEHFQSTD